MIHVVYFLNILRIFSLGFKELVYAQHMYVKLWMQVRSLESTKEA